MYGRSRYYLDRHSVAITTAAATEPITLAQAKDQCELPQDLTDDDNKVNLFIQNARAYAEGFCGRRWITQTQDVKFDAWDDLTQEIVLPYGPVQSVTHIQYIDQGGTTQTLSSSMYTVDTANFQGSIYPNYSLLWPVARFIPNAVTVRYVAGYGNQTQIPPQARQAMLMYVQYQYEQRGEIDQKQLRSIDGLLAQVKAAWM